MCELTGIFSRIDAYYDIEEDDDSRKANDDFDQAAGHGEIIRVGDSSILKKTQEAEAHFYEIISEYSGLENFTPKYEGSSIVDGEVYIQMEDLTANYQNPAMIDIKMGTRTWVTDMGVEKIDRRKIVDQKTTTGELGYRVLGYRRYNRCTESYEKVDKNECRNIVSSEVKEHLSQYYFDGVRLRKDAIQETLDQIEPIYSWFKENTDIEFVSSSLFILYEGNDHVGQYGVTVKMIDFPYVLPLQESPGRSRDEGYLQGLENLREALQSLLNEAS
ncbi:MAG: hypothetical protein CMO81_12270 [Waddliaceae bacterium]|nr:hypothetical protein [Waddliaceae bacterium]